MQVRSEVRKMKRPDIKVLHTCPLGTGGITSMVLNTCDHLNREKINFDYLVYRNQVEYNEWRAVALGGKKIVADNEGASRGAGRFLKKMINTFIAVKKEDEDIFHINASSPYDSLVGIAAKAAGIKKVIVHSHNANNSNKNPAWLLVNKMCKVIMPLYTDCYLTCSTEAADFMFPKRVFEKKQFYYIHNGIEINKFEFNYEVRERIRKELNIENRFVVGHVGRFFKQKNHEFLIDIMNTLIKKEPNAVLLLIGIGELQDSIKKKVIESGIEDKVIFFGASDNVNELLQAMDVFVMTSFHEGLPVVGVEAQAAGLPCIFSDTIAHEVNISGSVEFLSLKNDSTYWADKVINSKANNLERRKNADRVRSAGYDIQSTADDLTNIYYSLMRKGEIL